MMKNRLNKEFVGLAILSTLLTISVVNTTYNFFSRNDLIQSAVKITNMNGNSGGSGAILTSTDSGSKVITNAHVCEVVKDGGMIHTQRGSFQVSSYKQSQEHDVCIIEVKDNLGVNTKIAPQSPNLYYERASISGHPSLLPTVITKGHFSGKEIISVLTEIKPCSDEDMQNPNTIVYCIFFNGIPIIRNYEATLVTSTIMPGSSGSGVYNGNDELVGLAFAGSDGLSYAWTVPYEYMMNFINEEEKSISIVKPKMTVSPDSVKNNTRNVFNEVCSTKKNDLPKQIQTICKMVKRDLLWRN